MNLLNKYVVKETQVFQEETYTIDQFRKIQYDLIPYFIENCVDYLQNLSNNYIKLKNIQEVALVKYLDAYGYSLRKIIVNIENPEFRNQEQQFLAFNIPELIKNVFFYLNGSYYIPGLYILDKPIIYKKNSIKLYGLINSITMYFKIGDTRAIFGGKNIPIEYFLQWFLKDNHTLLNEIEDKFKINKTRYPHESLIVYFSNFFNCEEKEEIINELFNKLFFDNYTMDLYKKSYPDFDISFKNLVNYSITKFIDETFQVNFVDLKEKRLIFTELLLAPFFQRISDAAFNFCRGQKLSAVSFNEEEIIKFFMVNLKHQYFYDLVNLYSGIITMKASFMNPNSTIAPKEISSIHSSHFGRICPITISAKKPGESISFVPNTRVNKYGIFM